VFGTSNKERRSAWWVRFSSVPLDVVLPQPVSVLPESNSDSPRQMHGFITKPSSRTFRQRTGKLIFHLQKFVYYISRYSSAISHSPFGSGLKLRLTPYGRASGAGQPMRVAGYSSLARIEGDLAAFGDLAIIEGGAAPKRLESLQEAVAILERREGSAGLVSRSDSA
jgi:hypothetical protein